MSGFSPVPVSKLCGDGVASQTRNVPTMPEAKRRVMAAPSSACVVDWGVGGGFFPRGL